MATLIRVFKNGKCVGRCDASCYNAKHEKCVCCCGGKNHGKGHDRAIENTREMVSELVGAEVGREVCQMRLF